MYSRITPVTEGTYQRNFAQKGEGDLRFDTMCGVVLRVDHVTNYNVICTVTDGNNIHNPGDTFAPKKSDFTTEFFEPLI